MDGPRGRRGAGGSIAAPGVIDWANARLILDGKEVPYCIREGRVHWKARLTAPVTEPRAEDLLVFSTPLPDGNMVCANIVPGKRMTASALLGRQGFAWSPIRSSEY